MTNHELHVCLPGSFDDDPCLVHTERDGFLDQQVNSTLDNFRRNFQVAAGSYCDRDRIRLLLVQ